MDKLHGQLLALPARRVAADNKKHTWWAFGAVLVVVVGPILILCLVSEGALVALGSFLAACVLAVVCWFVGMLRGIVVVPALDDDAIERDTKRRAKEKLKVGCCGVEQARGVSNPLSGAFLGKLMLSPTPYLPAVLAVESHAPLRG